MIGFVDADVPPSPDEYALHRLGRKQHRPGRGAQPRANGSGDTFESTGVQGRQWSRGMIAGGLPGRIAYALRLGG